MSDVSAVLYTEAHRIEGVVRLRERLSEAMNDPLTDFLELMHVRISSLSHTDHPEVQWSTASIPKTTILVATLDMNEHESKKTRIDKVTQKKGTQVGAIVGSIEVYGTGHLVFDGAPSRVLTTQLTSFFPITDATLLLSQRADENRIGTSLALVNREMIRAFTIAG